MIRTQLFQASDLTGQGAPTLPVNGNFHVNELFGEVQIPIVQHNFIDDLSLSGRLSPFVLQESGNGSANSYNTDTYKLSAEFAPIRDIRFRGSYNRAVRAPNIVGAVRHRSSLRLDGIDRSVRRARHPRPTDYGCHRAGPDRRRRATPPTRPSQYNGLLGGNPDLIPEKATTKTVGVVLQPRFIPRFAFTVDYWNIKLKKAIQGFGADTILAGLRRQHDRRRPTSLRRAR